ncbi:MAG: LapA family protein [Deltaproteobacteria bacterium]|nr:MAG: LapA family protein [Deltaproteobacteria bacterium]
MKIKTIIILVLVALLVIFLLQNTEVIEVRFLFWQISMSRIVLLFSTLIVGLITGWFLSILTSKKS